MSDWQQPPQGYPPPPQAYPPQPQTGLQPPPPGGQYPRQVGAPKKRTGLIIAIVVIAVLLLCCCSSVAAFLLFRVGSSDESSSTSGISIVPQDPEAAKRAADWKSVQAAFTPGDYTLVKPDARQQRLAEAAVALLLPDFTVEEVVLEAGYFDTAKDYYVFDTVFVRVHLTSDPEARTAYSFDVETPEAEAAGLKRDDLTVDADEDATQIEGKTWVIFPTGTKAPLLRGITDPAIGRLVKQACTDWPDGLPAKFVAGSDGSMVLSVETWDSYQYSDTYDRIDATYVRDGEGWKLKSYVPVIEPKDGSSTEPTQT
jgi:hypothetical protein